MADSADTAADLSPADHVAAAVHHAGKAAHHAGEAVHHLSSHPDFAPDGSETHDHPDAPADGDGDSAAGSDGGSDGRSMSPLAGVSAQERRGFAAGSGAAHAMRQITGR